MVKWPHIKNTLFSSWVVLLVFLGISGRPGQGQYMLGVLHLLYFVLFFTTYYLPNGLMKMQTLSDQTWWKSMHESQNFLLSNSISGVHLGKEWFVAFLLIKHEKAGWREIFQCRWKGCCTSSGSRLSMWSDYQNEIFNKTLVLKQA